MPGRISVDGVSSHQKSPVVVEPEAEVSREATVDSVDTVSNALPEQKDEASVSTAASENSYVDRDLVKKSGHNLLAAFSAFPENVRFSGEEANEEVILLLRAHLITNVPWIVISVLLFIAPGILFPLIASIKLLPSLSVQMTTVIVIFWYLATFTYAFLNLLYWYFNVYIVTNERIIDVDWHSVVYINVAGTLLSKIEDANFTQVGVVPGLFDYGDVRVETAGADPNIEFANVPHPQLVLRKIHELMQKEDRELEGKGSGKEKP